MILLHVIYLALLPPAIELGVEVFRTRVLNRNDRHFISAAVRLAVMAYGAVTYPEAPWWETLMVMFSVHYLVFNYTFNRYALQAHWSFLGDNTLDALQKKVDPMLLLGIKLLLVVASLVLVWL